MRFDAYAGTVRGKDLQEVAEVIARDSFGFVDFGKPMRRYGEVLEVKAENRQVAWVGRDRASGDLYFEGKGETTPSFSESIRANFDHSVARADVCEDFDGEGYFDYLVELARKNKGPKVYSGFSVLSDRPEDGRTWVAGTRGAVSYIRIYEAGKMAERAHWERPNAVRFEGEFRPHYARDKQAAASMAPADFWGLSAWSHRVAEIVLQSELNRYQAPPKDYSEDRTEVYLARTFRRFWQERLGDYGSWSAIGANFEQVWKADDEAALKRK
jgi:hypothetical protein